MRQTLREFWDREEEPGIVYASWIGASMFVGGRMCGAGRAGRGVVDILAANG